MPFSTMVTKHMGDCCGSGAKAAASSAASLAPPPPPGVFTPVPLQGALSSNVCKQPTDIANANANANANASSAPRPVPLQPHPMQHTRPQPTHHTCSGGKVEVRGDGDRERGVHRRAQRGAV